jgi:hypothetical protein
LKNKLKMLVLVAKNRAELKLFLSRMSSALGEAGFERLGADCLGVVHWPYISKSWSAGDRLGVLASITKWSQKAVRSYCSMGVTTGWY